MIGDSLKDYHAAQHAGCDFALVKTGNGEEKFTLMDEKITHVYASLADAILKF
jgi:phosphoglycolate phosphatase-like HAD superfamily hydrolase